MMNVGEPVTIGDINSLIKEVDTNGDGVVDYNEFAKVVQSEAAKPFNAEPEAGGGKVAASSSSAAAEPPDQRKKGRRRLLGR